MKKFKRVAAILLALSMIFALTACGTAEESAASGETASEQTAAATPANEAAGSTEESASSSGDVDVNAALSGKTIGYVTINGAAPWGGLIGT